MTYKQFFKELSKLKGQYKLEADTKMIRAIDRKTTGYCPIAGLSMSKSGTDCVEKGAKLLKLSDRMANNIMDAADYHLHSKQVKAVRVGLLKTLGLKEAK